MADPLEATWAVMLSGINTQMQRKAQPEMFDMLGAQVTSMKMDNAKRAQNEIRLLNEEYISTLKLIEQGSVSFSDEAKQQLKDNLDAAVAGWQIFIENKARQ